MGIIGNICIVRWMKALQKSSLNHHQGQRLAGGRLSTCTGKPGQRWMYNSRVDYLEKQGRYIIYPSSKVDNFS